MRDKAVASGIEITIQTWAIRRRRCNLVRSFVGIANLARLASFSGMQTILSSLCGLGGVESLGLISPPLISVTPATLRIQFGRVPSGRWRSLWTQESGVPWKSSAAGGAINRLIVAWTQRFQGCEAVKSAKKRALTPPGGKNWFSFKFQGMGSCPPLMSRSKCALAEAEAMGCPDASKRRSASGTHSCCFGATRSHSSLHNNK